MAHLSQEFLSKYKTQKPPHEVTGMIVYKRTYSRNIESEGRKEEWWETCAREVNSIMDLGLKLTREEMEDLYDSCFNLKCSFSGRAKWQLGTPTVERIGGASMNNCWGVVVDCWKSFVFTFDMLMLGGGVGFNIQRENVYQIPKVKPGVVITRKDTNDADFIVPDSREGWCELLSRVMQAFFETGKGFSYSTVCIRGKGVPIKGFGGISSGPEDLCIGLQKICNVIGNRSGKKIRPIDALDIMNIIADVVIAGNVRRCLPEGSLVHTNRGLVNIENVTINDKVMSYDGKYHKVTNIFNQGVQETVIINHEDGNFECTPNHKMAIMNGVNSFHWKEAKNIVPSDRLLFVKEVCDGIKTSLPVHNYIKPPNSTTCRDITIPQLDENMAWFIGLFHGDGYVRANRKENGFNAFVSLVFDINELNIATKAREQLLRFNDQFNVTLQKRKNENSYEVMCVSKQLAWYFDTHIKKPNTCIVVPDFIKYANPNIRLAYLSGVLDSDGAANNRPVALVSSVYLPWVKELQCLLSSCGINSRIKEQTKKWESRKRWQFIHILALVSKRDKEMFSKIPTLCKKIRIGVRSSRSNGYPSEWITDKELITKCGLRQAKRLNCENIPNAKWIPVEVHSIVPGRRINTYDIEVENVHSFLVNGILTHNSAQISVGDMDDVQFLNAKRWDLGNIPNWRKNSNNTIVCNDIKLLPKKYWDNFKKDPKTGYAKGEIYGLLNISLSRKKGRVLDCHRIDPDVYTTNPCGEITLSAVPGTGEGESCNLFTLFISRMENKEQFIKISKLGYKVVKKIASLPYHWENTNKLIHENMRLGISVSGICEWLPKLSREEAANWLDSCYKELEYLDASYSKDNNWPESIKLTTVQPSGTLSKIPNTSPGVHPFYAPYYIQRIRFASEDPLLDKLREANYPIEYQMEFDGTLNTSTSIVSFPMKAPEGSIMAKDMTAVDQMELVKFMNTYWSDNSTSVTVYYREEELDSIKEWLENNYNDYIKSISFLLHSDHGFKQAPMEEIDEITYKKMTKNLKEIDFSLQKEGSFEIDDNECSTGACPIK